MSPFWKGRKDASEGRWLTYSTYKEKGKGNIIVEITDDLTNERTKIVLSKENAAEVEEPAEVIGVRNTSDWEDPPFYTGLVTPFAMEVKAENGKTYWIFVAIDEERRNRLRGAELLERTGRYEEAAAAYESLAALHGEEELIDKARELREKARRSEAKIISVDLNKLIQQLKEGGIVVAYSCPKCGANLNVSGDTKPESLNYCSYCGAKIEAASLASFLKSVL